MTSLASVPAPASAAPPGIVDAHHHVWDLTVRDQDWIVGVALAPIRRDFGIQDLEPLAAVAGVTASVVVQTVCVPEETPELLALARQPGGLVAAVVGWADLTAPDLADRLAQLREVPGGRALAAIRHQVQSEPDPQWLIRADVLRGLSRVAEAGLVYDLVITPNRLPAAERAAQSLPELVFVLDHLGKPPVAAGGLEPWAGAVRDLAALPNTVCKLSGLVTEARWDRWKTADLRPYADVVIEAFGPNRLLFGSDWPVCTLAADYAAVLAAARDLTAALTPAERHAIFAGTADRVYRLAERAAR